ncbi:RnfABCDGE type electron transport complex subunit D, partial [Rathayibacter iranicus]|uniref:RnfABCDGE type electron transport complex subunit D n=1 Tax=Rathayibacter iranicus TaxID=59737 RepID=UPI0011B09318
MTTLDDSRVDAAPRAAAAPPAPVAQRPPAAAPAKDLRVAALVRFAVSITVLTVVGRAFLGFEQSWTQWLVSLASAYAFELAFEAIDAKATGRRPAFAGGGRALVVFLLPAHIMGSAIALLIYPGDRYLEFVLANAVAAASKLLFRVPVGGRWRHVLNPSNAAISVMLLFFSWVGPAPPYHFTENVSGIWDWIVPAILLSTGLLLNIKLTRKWPLMLAWFVGFVLQALVRDVFLGDRFASIMSVPMGTAFVLFTCYMITDPGTTPTKPGRQWLFGLSIAAVYGVLAALGVPYGLFYSLTLVCLGRGIGLGVLALVRRRQAVPTPAAIESPNSHC